MKAYWQGTLSRDFLTFPIKLYTSVTRTDPTDTFIIIVEGSGIRVGASQ